MTKQTAPIELLAPAGNYEKLEIAIHYGADAVYLGHKDFSLRNYSGNFTLEEMKQAIAYAHGHGVKVYVACNIYPRSFEESAVSDFLLSIGPMDADAVIIADPGIFTQARRLIPHIPIHLSTQANTTSFNAALFWESLGVRRINVARELSLEEIKEISGHSTLAIEAFVHGAMCISYSGRCLLSSFLTKRDSNRGLCSHPCRWKYFVMEELRPDEYMPVAEDDRGSYIFNSKDLCMIGHLPEMIDAGISSFKIEGRMKGINYLAAAVKVYREAIDACLTNPAGYTVKKEWIVELEKLSNRGYSTGFYFNDPDQTSPNYSDQKLLTEYRPIGKVIQSLGNHRMDIEVRNKFFKGDSVEIFRKTGPVLLDTITDIIDRHHRHVPFAQPGSKVTVLLNNDCSPNDLIRRLSFRE